MDQEGKKRAARRARRRKRSSPSRGEQGAGRSRRKRRQKRTAASVLSSVILIAAVCLFVFSLYQMVMMLVPYYSGGLEYNKIKDLAITVEKGANDGQDIFRVDFDTLLKENEDTAAWIRFEQPEIISYPVVKSADNNEYLTKTFTANDNKLGTIFIDMRNSRDLSDRNTMIYGHNLKVGGEMFSQLNEYADEEFCKEHPYFYIYTPDKKLKTYRVFSAGVVKDTADNYKLSYATDEEFEAYIQLCRNSSNYQVDVPVTKDSRIVSLSTCTNVRDDERFLVQGVLIGEVKAP